MAFKPIVTNKRELETNALNRDEKSFSSDKRQIKSFSLGI